MATENFKLVDQVGYKTSAGQFQPLPGATQEVIPSHQLNPGEIETYKYEIEFIPVQGATFRNTVKVTITNHCGHLSKEFWSEPKADISPPSSPKIFEIDETAEVTEK